MDAVEFEHKSLQYRICLEILGGIDRIRIEPQGDFLHTGGDLSSDHRGVFFQLLGTSDCEVISPYISGTPVSRQDLLARSS